MFSLTALCCFSIKFNPLSYYKNGTWADDNTDISQKSFSSSIEQTIIDARQAYENKQVTIEQATASAEEEQKTAEKTEAAKSAAKSVGRPYATLYIERLGMEVSIYYGDDAVTLKKGPGQYTGSSLPGEGSQILIAGHNTSHFKPLQNIEIGDIIRIVTEYGEFDYKVITTRVASMKDTTTYNLSLDHEQLVLYTCYPFTGPPGKTERFFVYADLMG